MITASFQLHVVLRATLGILLVVTAGVSAAKTNGNSEKLGTPHPPKRWLNVRFIAARWGAKVSLSCFSSPEPIWYKKTEDGDRQKLTNSSRFSMTNDMSVAMFHIEKLQAADGGIYFCESNPKQTLQRGHCGTELKVMGVSSFQEMQDRNTLKDVIILVQTVLLVLLISIPVFLTLGKGDKKDPAGEEHTYEGLEVELVDTYEDIGIYQDKAEKWDLGEHPCEE